MQSINYFTNIQFVRRWFFASKYSLSAHTKSPPQKRVPTTSQRRVVQHPEKKFINFRVQRVHWRSRFSTNLTLAKTGEKKRFAWVRSLANWNQSAKLGDVELRFAQSNKHKQCAGEKWNKYLYVHYSWTSVVVPFCTLSGNHRHRMCLTHITHTTTQKKRRLVRITNSRKRDASNWLLCGSMRQSICFVTAPPWIFVFARFGVGI